MIGKPVDYDKKFKNNFPIFPAKLDFELRKYLNLIPGKEVLDLGIGQGRNSIPLAELGFNVTGVDYSAKCLEICKNTCDKLNLVQCDIRNFNIEKDKYDLIQSRFVLQFLHKEDSYEIIKNIKSNIKINGIVYIYVFSLNDPKYQKNSISSEFELLENNIFHNKIADTYISFFTKEEILNLFEDFKTICICDEYRLELDRETPYYAGFIRYIGQRIK